MSKQTFTFNIPHGIDLEDEVTNPEEFDQSQLVILIMQKIKWGHFMTTLQEKKFTNFTFKFADRVEKIELTCECLNYSVYLSVTELFDLQKRVKQLGGLAHCITLGIYYVNKNAVDYLSFNH